jgi:CheY-like chemotaxis protein
MSSVFDPGRLADITRAGADSPASFLAAFRRDLGVDVGKLLLAAGAADFAQVTPLAHRIEGACRMVGASALAEAAGAVAAISVGGDPAQIQLAIDRLVQRNAELSEVLDHLAVESGPQSAVLPQAQGESTQQPCGGLVFFVVEDHDFQRDMLVRLLRQLGAREVRGFADGVEALAAAREPSAAGAILVVDLAMPGLNGVELARRIGIEHLQVSIILNSALAEDLLSWPMQTARAAGVTVLGAIHKPVTQASLAPLIAQHRHNVETAGKR